MSVCYNPKMSDTENPNASRIKAIEDAMSAPDFWAQKDKAQALIKELQELKTEVEGGGKYDKANAIITIFSGAGGDDAEDFSGMLVRMYSSISNAAAGAMRSSTCMRTITGVIAISHLRWLAKHHTAN